MWDENQARIDWDKETELYIKNNRDSPDFNYWAYETRREIDFHVLRDLIKLAEENKK